MREFGLSEAQRLLLTSLDNLTNTGASEAIRKLNGVFINSSITGGLDYEGTWNAATNTPTVASGVGVLGQYYVVSVAGTTSIDGISTWQVGDMLLFNGAAWQRVSNNNVLSGLADVTITAAASGDFLRHNGSVWVDSTIQASDIPSGIDAIKIGNGDVTNTELSYIASATGTTGAGNIMFSISPITTGTLTAAIANFSGLVTANAALNVLGGNVDISGSSTFGLTFTIPGFGHGITGKAATNVPAEFFTYDANGGLYALGIRKTAGNSIPAVLFDGIFETASATVPVTAFYVSKKDGAATQALSATEMAYQFANLTTPLVTIMGNGNTTITGTTTVSGDLTVDTSTLKVDATNNRVGIRTATPTGILEVLTGGGTTGLLTDYIAVRTSSGTAYQGGIMITNSIGATGVERLFKMTATFSATGVAKAAFGFTSSTATETFIGSSLIEFFNNNDVPFVLCNQGMRLGDGMAIRTTTTTANTFNLEAYDVNDTIYRVFATLTSGNTPTMTLSNVTSSTAFSPTTNDGGTLGSTSLQWSDLFLAEGGVINWDNGDVTITQTGNTLAFAGASTSYTFDALVSTVASGTGSAGLRVPHGTAPSSPVDGDVWTTAAGGLFARINGATVNYTAGAGFAWGTTASGTSGTGLALTASNSSSAGVIGQSIVVGNTQTQVVKGITIDTGTSAVAHVNLTLTSANAAAQVSLVIDPGTASTGYGINFTNTGGTGYRSVYWTNFLSSNNFTRYGLYFTGIGNGGGTSYGIYQAQITGSSGSATNYGIYQDQLSLNSSGTTYGIFQNILAGNAATCIGWHVASLVLNSNTNPVGAKYFSLNNAQSAVLRDWTTDTAEILHSRTSTRTTGTTADDFSLMYLKRTTVQNGAGGTTTATGAVLKLENVATQTAGTLTDTVRGLHIIQNSVSTGDGIFIDYNAAGNAINIDGDVNSASAMYGVVMDLANAGAGLEYAFRFDGAEKGITAAGNLGFVSNSTGTFTCAGYIRVNVSGTEYRMPYGTIA